jgi:hypothetical protein
MSIDTTPGDEDDFSDLVGVSAADIRRSEPDEDDLSDLVDDGTSDIPRTDLDEDEQEAADELEVDQTELEELGLTLDDPHQPEDE